MARCMHCGQEIQSPEAAASVAGHAPNPAARVYVKIADHSAFRELCNLVLSSPNCKDQKHRDALEDFPSTLRKYGQLTQGQWKFFCAIHKQVFGTWPPKPEDIRGAVQEDKALDFESAPF